MLPLKDKLSKFDSWITGLRRQKSHTRAGIGVIELYSLRDGSGRVEGRSSGFQGGWGAAARTATANRESGPRKVVKNAGGG